MEKKKDVVQKDKILVKKTVKDIARVTAKRFKGIAVPDMEKIIYEIFDVIREMIIEDDNYILIKNFGGFYTVDKEAYTRYSYLKEKTLYSIPRHRIPRAFFTLKFKKDLREKDAQSDTNEE